MKYKIRTIIVEDEMPIREEILDMAVKIEKLQIVGVGKNGNDLETLLLEKKPDLALLDIELPVKDSMTVLSEQKKIPHLIFISAYEMYAPQAFEMAAVDYLVKPVSEERFNKAVRRAMEKIQLIKANNSPSNKGTELFWIRENERIIPIPLSEIIYLEARNKTTFIYTQDTRHFSILRPLTGILQQIEAAGFVQIHRKYAVNKSKIMEMQPMFHGRYEIAIKDLDHKLPVSRRYATKIFSDLKMS